MNTVKSYELDIKSFINTLPNISIADVSYDNIIDFLQCQYQAGYAVATMNRRVAAIKQFFNYAKEEGFLKENPCEFISIPKQKRYNKLPLVLTQDQVDQLLSQPPNNTNEGRRDRAILMMLYATGLRASELCQLNVHDVQDRHVHVIGKGSKVRLVPIVKVAVELIDQYLAAWNNTTITAEQPLFVSHQGRRLSRVRIWQLVKQYAGQIGLPPAISPHTLRHSFATHLLANGADIRVIQELLGHADISTTDHYTHMTAEQLKQAFDTFHPRF